MEPTNTQAEALSRDPRIKEAKRLLTEALNDAQKNLNGVSPRDSANEQYYKDLLLKAEDLRGGKLWYPYLGSGLGKGALVELEDGSVKYDFISGIGVHYLGHNHPIMLEAGIDAALSDTLQQGHLQQNCDSVELMESLVQLANKKNSFLKHCFLTTSGAMANENALKMVFQKNHPATRILSFHKCFSGRTMALAQLTDKAAYRSGLPNAMEVDYIPFFDAEKPKESTAAAISTLKAHLSRFPGEHAAMCLELVQGEAGYFAGSTDFFDAIIKVLKDHNIAVWVDEIQTFGRLSEAFAFQHFGLDHLVDVVTIGKMSQVCATLYSEEYKPRPGLLSQTFTSSTHAIKASTKIIEMLDNGDLTGAEGKNMQFHKIWQSRCSKTSGISGPFGIGGMFAFTVGDGSIELAKLFTQKLFKNGVIGFIAGSGPTRVRFLPPIAAISEEDIHAVCDIIEQTLAEF